MFVASLNGKLLSADSEEPKRNGIAQSQRAWLGEGIRERDIRYPVPGSGVRQMNETHLSDFTVLNNINMNSITWRVQENQEYSLKRLGWTAETESD